MLQKFLTVMALALTLAVGSSQKAAAQKGSTYDNAIGMRLDVGSDYGTLVGISGKHFFGPHNAGEAQVLFGSRLTMINLEYQYHGNIPNAAGLRWVAGVGGGVALAKKYSSYDYYDGYYYTSSGGTDVLLRPVLGLDYKVNNIPLNFAFDWRPSLVVTHGTSFTPARFGIAARFAF